MERRQHYHYHRREKKEVTMNRRSSKSDFENLGMDKVRIHFQRLSMSLGARMADNITHSGVDEISNKRKDEKKLMQNLNDRLAVYISKVRTLETENKALREALNKKRQGFDLEPMKKTYQAEIDEIKKLLEEANKENAQLKAQIVSFEDQLVHQRSVCSLHDERIDELQHKVNSLNDENAHRTAECDMLRRNVEELEKQVAHWKDKYNIVYTQLKTTRNELEEKTHQYIFEYSRAEALQEDLEFLKHITDTEIKEYKAMLSKEDEIGVNVRDTWGDEFNKCLNELREEYEQRLDDISQEMSSRYESQLAQISQNIVKTESSSVQHYLDESRKYRIQLSQKDMRINELEGQLERMNLELKSLQSEVDRVTDEWRSEKEKISTDVAKILEEKETIFRESQTMMEPKSSLFLEILAYRKLLEAEEKRLANLKQTENRSEDDESNSDCKVESSQVIKSEIKSSSKIKITMTRSSKGILSFDEIDTDGRFVAFVNTGTSQPESMLNLKGWKVIRKLLATETIQEATHEFVFENEHVIGGGQNFKIWAKNREKESDFKNGDISTNIENWGETNRSSVLELIDDKGAVKATMSIKACF